MTITDTEQAERDAAQAADLRELERRLRIDADSARHKADEARSIYAPAGVLRDYLADVARHWTAMAASADFHADEAATRAADLETHALAGAA